MADKEKVINGIERHIKKVQTANSVSCLECPYSEPKPIREWCMSGLMDDIYALLKEQKIAMKPKNIDKVGGNCPVCGLRMARSHKYCYQCGQEMDWK